MIRYTVVFGFGAVRVELVFVGVPEDVDAAAMVFAERNSMDYLYKESIEE